MQGEKKMCYRQSRPEQSKHKAHDWRITKGQRLTVNCTGKLVFEMLASIIVDFFFKFAFFFTFAAILS